MVSENAGMLPGGTHKAKQHLRRGAPGMRNKKHSDDVRLVSSLSGNANA